MEWENKNDDDLNVMILTDLNIQSPAKFKSGKKLVILYERKSNENTTRDIHKAI